jgi:hypothetical protein
VSSEQTDPFDSLRSREANLPPPSCSAAIRHECTKDLKPCVTKSLRARFIAGLVLIALTIGIILSLSRQPLGEFGSVALFGAAGWALIQLLILMLSFGRWHRPQSHALRLAILLGVPLAFVGYLTLGNSGHLPLNELLSHPQESNHLVGCGMVSFVIGACASLGILLLWRRTDPFTPRLSGALAGLIGGLAAAIPMGLVCPGKECWHLWLSHGVSLVLVIVLGATLGRRWLTP